MGLLALRKILRYFSAVCLNAPTGALSEDCKVSGWNQAIDLSLEMTSQNAKKFCIGVSDLARKQRMKFDEGWKIRIYSPYSNGKTIATCKLPT